MALRAAEANRRFFSLAPRNQGQRPLDERAMRTRDSLLPGQGESDILAPLGWGGKRMVQRPSPLPRNPVYGA